MRMAQPPHGPRPEPSGGSLFSRLRRRLTRMMDDALPVTQDERGERDWTGETSSEEAERRQQELEIKLLEKQGKGGPR
jgi:hypothetical protein